MWEQFEKAFVNRLKEAIEGKEVEYVVAIIGEIRDRLKNLVPNNKKYQEALDSNIDLVLFKQELEHDVFGDKEFYQVVETFITTIKELQPPSEDADTDLIKKEIQQMVEQKLSYSEAVPKIVLRLNKKIDRIYKSVAAFRMNPQNVVLRGIKENQKLENSKDRCR
jgi:hypothetical protein